MPEAGRRRTNRMLMASQKSTGFDPYRAWLDVDELHRPLNAYELLGLEPLEQDLDAIHEAANRKRAALELHRYDAPPEIWQQVHHEVEAAVGILFDADKIK